MSFVRLAGGMRLVRAGLVEHGTGQRLDKDGGSRLENGGRDEPGRGGRSDSARWICASDASHRTRQEQKTSGPNACV